MGAQLAAYDVTVRYRGSGNKEHADNERPTANGVGKDMANMAILAFGTYSITQHIKKV